MIVQQPRSAYQAKKDGEWATLSAEINACLSEQELDDWWAVFCARRARTLPDHWTNLIREAVEAQRDEVRGVEANRALDRLVGEIAGLR